MKPKNIEERIWIVYSLSDPRNNAIRYIGCTVGTAKRRLQSHLARAQRTTEKNVPLIAWIRSLLSEGLSPIMDVLESGVGATYPERECHWIKVMREAGADLTNITVGGPGVIGYSFTVEDKGKISDALKGRKHNPERIIVIVVF